MGVSPISFLLGIGSITYRFLEASLAIIKGFYIGLLAPETNLKKGPEVSYNIDKKNLTTSDVVHSP